MNVSCGTDTLSPALINAGNKVIDLRKKTDDNLDQVKTKFQSLDQMAKKLSSTMSGKLFLGVLGFSSVMQIIDKVGQAVGDLIGKMSEAAKKGESVGDAINMWAAGISGADNATSLLNKRLERQNELLKNQQETEEQLRKLRGLPDASDEDKTFAKREAEIQVMRNEAEALKKTIAAGGIITQTLIKAGVSQFGEDLKGRLLDIEQAESALEQDRKQMAGALGGKTERDNRKDSIAADAKMKKGDSDALQERIANWQETTKALEEFADKQKKIWDETRTPLEQYLERIEELKKLKLDPDVLARATKLAADKLAKATAEGPLELASANVMGSQSASNALQRHSAGRNPMSGIEKNTKEQIVVMKDVATTLKGIQSALPVFAEGLI